MKLIRFFTVYLLWGVLASLQGIRAQQTIIDVTLDVPDLMIGEQTLLHVSVTTDKDKQVLIPLPGEKLMNGVEVLGIMPPDTTDIKNNRINIRYDLVITSFDSSLYLLPPFIAIDGKDTVFSHRIALKVSSPDVNLDKPEEFFDIKSIWRPPFVLSDYYALYFGTLFVLFLICVTGYFIQRLRRRPEKVKEVDEGPKLPSYEIAFSELKAIRERKLWQQGRNKEYYTEVTDTLRRYITARYGEAAMEKTSSEILEILRTVEPGNKYVNDLLKQILLLSDFVKFAKLHPLPDENELTMFNANLFVDRTKPVENIAPNTTQDDIKNEEPINK